jgi:uncharacterized protein (DUF2336 family)
MPDSSSFILEVEQAITSGTLRQRLKALKQVTDLFVAGSGRYTEEQISVFDDVLLRLMAVVESEARASLARRLAQVADAPPQTIRTLAFDEAIEVAGPVLTHCDRIEDAVLVANARIQGQPHLYAISRRRTLSEAVTDVLIDRGDRRVVRSVAENAGARISEAGFGKLVTRAGADDTLAKSLGLRRDIPRHHFVKLLETASAAVREKLADANPDAAAAVRTAVAEAAGRIGDEVRDASRDFTRAKKATKRRYTTRQLTEGDIHAAASSQNFEKVVAALALLGHIPVDLVERALVDRNPEIVLILAKAAGCSRTTAKTLLLMQVADRGMSAHDIEAALTKFERLSVASARRVINYYITRNDSGATVGLRADTLAEAAQV